MKSDIILAGVGGQGILTIAYVLDNAALASGMNVKQSEVHGMSQRGGAVYTHIRISDDPISSDLIGLGQADFIVGVEPLEAIRYADYLCAKGHIISNTIPEVNIPNYPDLDAIHKEINNYSHTLFDAKELAKEAGSPRAQNIVLVGALSHFLPLEEKYYRQFIEELFAKKGEKIVETNFRAFEMGRQIAGQEG
jgi:indolepyruvate ferredoxin oxidoreductase beta subunit